MLGKNASTQLCSMRPRSSSSPYEDSRLESPPCAVPIDAPTRSDSPAICSPASASAIRAAATAKWATRSSPSSAWRSSQRSGSNSEASHAIRTGCPSAGKAVSGPAPPSPASSRRQLVARSAPRGVTAPRPVTTTRRCSQLIGSTLSPPALALRRVGPGCHGRAENRPATPRARGSRACKAQSYGLRRRSGYLRAGWVGAARRSGRGSGRSLDDRRSAGGDRIPLGAEDERALPLCLTRLLVERVGVERVLVVGHLQAAVAAPRRSEQRPFDAWASGRLAVEQGRPEPRAAPAT